MSFEITINIPQLDALTEAIRLLSTPAVVRNLPSDGASAEKPAATTSAKGKTKPDLKVVDGGKPEAAQSPAAEDQAEEKAAATQTTAGTTTSASSGTITDDELRLATAEKAKANKEAVRDLVKDYADNLTSIAQEHRAEYLAKLAAL